MHPWSTTGERRAAPAPRGPVWHGADDHPATMCTERTVALAFLAAIFLLRLACILRYRIDSDESQHLHVVWAWTRGLVPYRDVFDNHMPLFHLLCAPLLLAIGERPWAVIAMRIAMLPLFALTLWAVGRLARTLFSPRAGLWAMVLGGLVPRFFLCSVEFRPDDLWTVLWLVALVVLVEGRLTPRRSLAAGLLLGAALGVSLKTVLMLVALAGAVVGTLLVARLERVRARPPLARCAGAALAGMLLIPLAVTALFATQGALGPYLYGTIWHNLVPGLGDWTEQRQRWALFPVSLPLLWAAAYPIFRSTPRPGLGARRAFVFLVTAGYLGALTLLWPLRERESYLPFYPLVMLLVTPLILRAGERVPGRPAGRLLAPTLAALVGIGGLCVGDSLKNLAPRETRLLADVLRLTGPDDPVLDLKGETVFRRRPYYYVLEAVTKARLTRGLLRDDIPERLIATGTTVVVNDVGGFPRRAQDFLLQNYVPVGSLRVAGCVIGRAEASGDRLGFDVQIATRYALVTDGGPASGLIDGTRYDGPRFLAPGHHEYTRAETDGRVAVVWAQAVERGFTPFYGQGVPG